MAEKKKQSNRMKKTGSVNARGRARVQAKRDLIGGDKNVGRDEYNARGDMHITQIEHLTMSETRTPLAYDDLKQKYLGYVVGEWQKLRLIGFSHGRTDVRDPFLEEIFVPLKGEQLTYFLVIEGERRAGHLRETRISEQDLHERGIAAIQVAKFNELLSGASRLVVLGTPGAGKSTLLQYIALMFGHGQANEQFGVEGTLLPLCVILREFAQERRKRGAGYALQDYLHDYYHARGQEFPPEFFHYYITQGGCILLFDGMDEVGTAARRIEMRDLIASLARSYPSNRVVVSSRPKGYEAAPLDKSEFETFSILDFDDEDIKRFITNWYRALEGRGEPEAKRGAEELFDNLERNPSVKRLAVNPLLLTIITTLFRSGGLPHQRVKLYDKCAESLILTIDAQRGLIDLQLGEEEQRRRLEHIAYWMHSEQLGEVSRDELQFNLARFLKGRYADVQDEARRFIDRLVERTGILVERSPDQFGFAHPTFQEYFAAMDIYYRYLNEEDPQIIEDAVIGHLHDSRWEEVVLLTIAKLTVKPATRIVESILNAGSWGEDVLHRDLFFGGRVLADDVKVEQSLHDQIVDTLLEFTREDPLRNKTVQAAAFQSLANLAGDQRVVDGLIDLAQNLQVKPDLRVSALDALGKLGQTDFAVQILLTLVEQQKLNWWIQRRALDVLVKIGPVEETVRLFVELMADPYVNEFVKRDLAEHLGQLGRADQEVVDALLEAIRDWDADRQTTKGFEDTDFTTLQVTAVLALDKLGLTYSTLPLLTDLVRNKNMGSAVRGAAAQALRERGDADENVVDALSELARDRNATGGGLTIVKPHEAQFVTARSIAVHSLALLGHTDDALSIIVQLVSDTSEDSEARGAAVQLMGKVGAKNVDASNAILNLAQDKTIQAVVRVAAARMLSQLDQSEIAYKRLLVFAEDQYLDSVARCHAAWALTELGQADQPVQILKRIAQERQSDPWGQRNAAILLGRLGYTEDAEQLFLRLAQDAQNDSMRGDVAMGLGNLGRTDPEVMNLLLQYSREEHEYLRNTAFDALNKLIGNFKDES